VKPPRTDPELAKHPAHEAEARLAALAAEGRERQAAALAAEAAEERRIARRERRQVERLGRGNAVTALLESPRGPALPLFRITAAVVIVATALLFVPGYLGADSPVWSAVGVALLAAAIGVFFLARWAMGRAHARMEGAWLVGLPFPVRGYFRVLGGTPSEEREVKVRIEFRDAVPDRETLDGLLGRVEYPATARLTGGGGKRWTAESGTIRSPAGGDVDPTNGAVLWWMRVVVDEVLLPLHEAYPLRSVRFAEG
jgi:hypothetical protein